MNLICLTCGGEFSADAEVIGTDGATIKCDHCGMEQPLFVRRRAVGAMESGGFRFSQELISSADRMVAGGGVEGDSPDSRPPVPRPSSAAGTFKKPMSSTWVDRRAADSAVAQPSSAASSASEMTVDGDVFEVPDLAASIPNLVEETVAGPFVVRSPAALVFEFPDFLVLEEWAHSIEKLDKYSVQDAAGTDYQLGEFIRGNKAGRQRADVLRNAMKAGGMTDQSSALESYEERLRDVDVPGGGARRDGGMASAQFQFKIEEEKSRDPRKAILAIVLGIAGVGIILGALFLLGVIEP